MRASDPTSPGTECLQEALRSCHVRYLGPGCPDAPQCVRIAAADDTPAARAESRVALDELVVLTQHRAVACLERRHFECQPQIRRQRRLPSIEVQQVIEREEHIVFAQAGDHVEDISAQRLDLPMQRFAHAVHAKMHLDVAIGEAARDLLADDEILEVGFAIEQLQAAVDRIVIGDRHQIHAARCAPRGRHRADRSSNRGCEGTRSDPLCVECHEWTCKSALITLTSTASVSSPGTPPNRPDRSGTAGSSCLTSARRMVLNGARRLTAAPIPVSGRHAGPSALRSRPHA